MQTRETVRGTKRHAERVLRERLKLLEDGFHHEPSNLTVKEYLRRWLDDYAVTHVRPKTLYDYRLTVERKLIPAFGNRKLQQLTPAEIQGFYSELQRRGLASRTVLGIHRVLHQALRHAVKWGHLARNPVEATEPPRAPQKEINVWDRDSLERFFEAAAESRMLPVFQFALLTGMRRSEILGLKWEDVDLDNGRLSIVRTLQFVSRIGLLEDKPKTNRSRRSIALSGSAVELLRSVRMHQTSIDAALGEQFNLSRYVFVREDGRPIRPESVTIEFRRLVKTADLPKMTLHGLRHLHATLLLEAGVHPKVVSERLGHSSVSTTLDTYSHVLPTLQSEAAIAIERQLPAMS